jgi:hypothetical protein
MKKIREDDFMRKVKFLLLAIMIAAVVTPSVYADVPSEKTQVDIQTEEKSFGIDLSQVETDSPKERKLVANYGADFKDLQAQILDKNSHFVELSNELETKDISLARKKALKDEIKNIENHAKETARKLLKLRYTADKTKIRPEIIQAVNGKQGEKKKDKPVSILGQVDPVNPPSSSYATWLIYPDSETYTVGNHGYADGSAASYSHNSYNNVSKVFADSGMEVVHSGMLINPVIDYPGEEFTVDFRFRYVEANGQIYCPGFNSSAIAAVSMNLYDVTNNEMDGFYDWSQASGSCSNNGGNVFDVGPSILYMNNYTVQNRSYYYVFMETYGYGSANGDADYSSPGGVKWQYLEVNVD